MFISFHSILKANRGLFRNLWHLLSILLILVSNFGAMATPAQAQSLVSSSTHLFDFTQWGQSKSISGNSRGKAQEKPSRLASKTPQQPKPIHKNAAARSTTMSSSPELALYGYWYSNTTYYAYFPYDTKACVQVNDRTVTCSGSIGMVGTHPDLFGLYFDLDIRLGFPQMPWTGGPARVYYSYQGGQTGGGTTSTPNTFVSAYFNDAIPYTQTESGYLDVNVPTTPYNFNDWHFQLATPTPGYSWYGFFNLTMSLDPIGQSVPAESVYCPTCSGISHSAAPSQKFLADPVNTRTSNFFYPVDDFSLNTADGPLSFRHMYVSTATDKYISPLGRGWTHNQDIRLVFPSDPAGKTGYLLFKDQSGNMYRFIDNGNGTYTSYAGVNASLVQNATSPVTYTIVDDAQNTYNFDQIGRLQTQSDVNGKGFSYSYNTAGKLYRVTALDDTQYLQFNYDTSGNLSSVADSTGRSVSMLVGSDGNLTSTTDILGHTWTYQYDFYHGLTRVLDPNMKTVVRNEYSTLAGQSGWVTKQYDGNDNLVMELTQQVGGTVQVKNALNQVAVNSYNTLGTLTGDQNISGDTTHKVYDTNFRPINIADPLNNPTTMLWSVDGSDLTSITDAANNETTITYIDHKPHLITDPNQNTTTYNYTGNLLTSVVAGGKTTSYNYYTQSPRQGLLETVTDPTGQVTKYEYDTHGQQTKIIVNYDESHTENEAGLYNLTTTYQYDALGRVTDIATPTGKTSPAWMVTHSEYDAAGHPVFTIQNYDSNYSQNYQDLYNITTHYYYDVRGNQIATVDTYGVVTRTYYDDANHVIAVVRNLTGQTIETNSPPARGSGGVGLNLRTDNTYDAAGNLIATQDEKGIITRTYTDLPNHTVTVVRNLQGQAINVSTPPVYDPSKPDENVRSQTASDANGNVIATIDNSGIVTRTYYDVLNRPTLVVQNLSGQSYTVSTPPTCGQGNTNLCTTTYYDDNGNAIATQDPLGHKTRTYYDSLNRPVRVVQNLTTQGYDVGWLENADCNQVDADGNISVNLCTDTIYDDAGRVIATQDPQGHITRTWYDAAGRAVTVVRNLVLGQGQDIQTVTPPARESGGADENIRTDTEYDASGRAILKTDPLGHQTKYEYDLLGHVWKTTINPLDGYDQNYQDTATKEYYNLVTTYSYDALGRTLTTTDTTGRATTTEYDNQTGLTLASIQGNLQTSYSYDPYGQQIAVTNPQGKITRSYFDSLGRTRYVVRNLTNWSIDNSTPPNGQTSSETNLRTETTYDDNGQVHQTVAEDGKVTEYGYDDLGRQTSLQTPLVPASHSSYDALGRLVDATASNGVVTHYGYDAVGRLTDVWENYQPSISADEQTNVHTRYTYDANGNQLSITDGNGHVTSFSYDALGHLYKETDALGYLQPETVAMHHSWTYTYDKNGNRVSMLDANQATTNYAYDSQGHLTAIDYPGSAIDVTFSYDVLGRRIGMSDALGQTTWNDYNNLDLPASITDPFGKTVGYGYDTLGNRNSLTYPQTTENPSGRIISYGLDPLRRINAVLEGQLSLAGYQYNLAGQLDTVTLANGVTSHYTYDDAGQLASITHRKGEQELASYQYPLYDTAGNRKQAVENVQLPAETPPTPTATATPTETNTLTATVTATSTVTSTATATFVPTHTATTTQTITSTPTVSQTPTITTTPTSTATATPTPTLTPTTAPNVYTLVLQPNSTDGQDVYILKSDATTNYGTSPNIGIGEKNTSTDSVARGLIKFDLTSLPSDATIVSATLSLWTNQDLSDVDTTIQVYRLKTAFNETQATWNQSATGVNWQVAGASGANDRESTSIGSVQVLANEALNTEKQISLTPSKIQEMINGTFTNNGFLLATNIELNDRFNYNSSDAGSSLASQFPKLVIQYTSPSTNPTPTYTPTRTPTATPAPGSIFSNSFESGDLSAWSSVSTAGGSLSVSSQSAAVGQYGLQATVNGTNPMYVRDHTPDLLKHYRSRFYFNPNTFRTITGDRVFIFNTSNDNFRLSLTYTASGFWLQTEVRDDAGAYHGGKYFYITDNWQALEFEWQAASAVGANDGYLKTWINNTLVETRSGLDNDTESVDYITLGLFDSLDAGMSGTLYFDGFVSKSTDYIGLDPNGPALSAPQNPPDQIMADDFESGDFSHWSWNATDNGDLSVSTAAAHQGTYGLQAVINDTNSLYLTDDSPLDTPHYRAKFYLDPNSLTMTNGNSHDILVGYNRDNTDSIFRVYFYRSSGQYKLQTSVKNDSLVKTYSAKYPISDDWHQVEIEWQAASAPGANDGYMSLWIDNTLAETISGVDNDTFTTGHVDFGIVGNVETGTSGTMYFDQFESYRTSSHQAFQPDTGKMALAAWHPKALYQQPDATSTPTPTPTVTATVTATATPTQAATGTPTLLPIPNGLVTIDYVYDPLNRLVSATYSNGITYAYTYDAVGNRLSQTITINGVAATTLYEYDNANRLSSVGGVTYTYDDNGNLTFDGTNTYTYDAANRLSSVGNSSSTVTYTYRCNGLSRDAWGITGCNSDRVSQTVNGVTINYVLDLNSDLTQVLSDGTNDYIYGVGRIAQVNATGTEYFLGDALGSMRQMTDATGAVTLAKSYQPYGEVASSTGSGVTSYGFTGEMTDSTGLVYLRARMYAPNTGRFLTRDTWQGDYNRPLSLNRWVYVEDNPTNLTDPSGHCVDPFCIPTPPTPIPSTPMPPGMSISQCPLTATPTAPTTPLLLNTAVKIIEWRDPKIFPPSPSNPDNLYGGAGTVIFNNHTIITADHVVQKTSLFLTIVDSMGNRTKYPLHDLVMKSEYGDKLTITLPRDLSTDGLQIAPAIPDLSYSFRFHPGDTLTTVYSTNVNTIEPTFDLLKLQIDSQYPVILTTSNRVGWFGNTNNPGGILHGGDSGGGVFKNGKWVGALSGVYPGYVAIQRFDNDWWR